MTRPGWTSASAPANDGPEVASYYAGDGIAGAWLKLANDLVGAIDPPPPSPAC